SWALLRLHAWYAFSGDAEGKQRMEKLVAGMKATELAATGFGADLKRSEFFSRFGNYATLLCAAQPQTLDDFLKRRPITADELTPVASLPRAAHGLGLNWSRAWALKALSETVAEEADRRRFQEAYAAHVAAAWKHHGMKAGDIYAYDHWVPQFAVYALTE